MPAPHLRCPSIFRNKITKTPLCRHHHNWTIWRCFSLIYDYGIQWHIDWARELPVKNITYLLFCIPDHRCIEHRMYDLLVDTGYPVFLHVVKSFAYNCIQKAFPQRWFDYTYSNVPILNTPNQPSPLPPSPIHKHPHPRTHTHTHSKFKLCSPNGSPKVMENSWQSRLKI